MNGAEALLQTLSDCGVDVCFANPGTSEMQLVAALDKQPNVRAILGLFEGVVTGAADGYGRMADKPAATLLHLGPGLGNGLSNLHNAKRARTPLVNIVGDHAVDHLQYDAPLTSDVAAVARPMSDWVRTSTSPDDLAVAGEEAVQAALVYPGQIATLIAPADHAWTDGAHPTPPNKRPKGPEVSARNVADAVAALGADGSAALFLGGRALREDALHQAGRIAAATGARLISETFSARLQRGAGRVTVERLPYFGERASEFLVGLTRIVFVGAEPPVSFFAYPGKPSWLSPEGAELIELAGPRDDAVGALRRLADALDAPADPDDLQAPVVPPVADGKLDAQSLGGVLASLMPENAIVSDEAATAGLAIFPMTQGAAKHDWLMLTGGSIGQGLPLAAGAAVACPERKVIALQADGSAMYTVQALWTMARENLDVTTVIINNGSYAILNIELARVGVTHPGPKALSLLDLTRPAIDWVSISEGLGVPAVRADTVEGFRTALAEALSTRGPRLVEAVVPAGV
ncbi:MAG: acetolactate synthase large subunit [Gammaproteobacteria bacterium]|nr:acetolactate synthase large subunit [Gammaproteobacteria bacterium]MDH3577553.1 acetolactate synthase large subunit [Gammaproteobacteria bacterium]